MVDTNDFRDQLEDSEATFKEHGEVEEPINIRVKENLADAPWRNKVRRKTGAALFQMLPTACISRIADWVEST